MPNQSADGENLRAGKEGEESGPPLDAYEALAIARGLNVRLWWRLVTCTILIERQVRTQLDTRYGITMPQFQLMALLDHSKTGLTMGELSRGLRVSNGNVTGIVRRLLADGLVVREVSKTDHRAFIIHLSRGGQRLFRRMIKDHEGWIDGLVASLSRSDIRRLSELLEVTHAKLWKPESEPRRSRSKVRAR